MALLLSSQWEDVVNLEKNIQESINNYWSFQFIDDRTPQWVYVFGWVSDQQQLISLIQNKHPDNAGIKIEMTKWSAFSSKWGGPMHYILFVL